MAKVTLLDGGMGQELVRRAGDRPTPLWATQVMMDRPGLVEQIHRDFLAAGATVATSNTYALLPDRLIHAGIPERLDTLRAAAFAEARAAREAHGSGRIAGAIGPLIGSYRPEAFPAHDVAVAEYRPVVAALEPEADLLLFETVASLAHVEAALCAAQETSREVWLSVTVDDIDGTRLRSGEPVAEVADVAAGRAQALLANCSAPEAMGAAIEALLPSGVPVGAYANGFERITRDFLSQDATVESLSPRRDMGPERYARHARDWVAQGARIVGGCCEVGPNHIRAIAEGLGRDGHEIV